MIIYLRDLTVDEDIRRVLPCDDLRLVDGHEYIIIDGDIDCGECFSVEELNKFLKETEVDIETLKILNSTYLWNEVMEMVKEESFIIIDFDTETASWNCGSGVPDTDEWVGRLMYELGYNSLPCEIPKVLEDYINWEVNWTSLECEGWCKTRYNGNTYIVHR